MPGCIHEQAPIGNVADVVFLALDAPDIQMIEAPTSWEGGQTAFEQLWSADRRPTAIVAMSDIMAIGVMDAAKARRLHLPRDLSVVGFDDLPDARHMRPGLTTVRQPVEEKGRLAADMLVAALAKISRDSPLVFSFKSRGNCRTQWAGACRRAGIKYLSYHRCRAGDTGRRSSDRTRAPS